MNVIIDRLQKAFPPNRIVLLLTPLVFVPAAAALSAWIGQHFPGIALSDGTIIGFATAGAIAAIGAAYKWIDRWQEHEREQPVPFVAVTDTVVQALIAQGFLPEIIDGRLVFPGIQKWEAPHESAPDTVPADPLPGQPPADPPPTVQP